MNTAGATQINAMQNKANEIEQSWPSDYSELTDAVDDMIAIQPTEPTSEDTKIWINSSNTQTTVQVPTYEELTELSSAINVLEPAATSADVGKFLKAKTVSGGKVTEYEFGETGTQIVVDSVLSNASENPVQNKTLYNELNIVERTVIPAEPITYLNGNTNTPTGYSGSCISLNVGADEPIYIENIDVRATSGKTVKIGFFSFRRITEDKTSVNYNRGYFTLLEWIAEVVSVDTHAVYTPAVPILYDPLEKHLLAVTEESSIGYLNNINNGLNVMYAHDRPLYYTAQVGVEITDPTKPTDYLINYSPTPTWEGLYTSPAIQGAYSVTYETEDSEPTIVTTVTNVKEAVEELINADPPIIPNGYNPLYGKKWAACGDSVTMGVEEVNVDGVYWTYEQFIAERNGMQLYKDGISGSTMAVSDPSDVSYKYPFSVDRYKDVPTDCDYITIWFGINDNTQSVPIGTISDTVNTTFYGAYNKVLTYLIANIPNAKIGLVVSHMISTDMATAIRNIAKKYGLLVFDIPGDEKIPFWSPNSSATTNDVDATIKTQRTTQWWVNPSHPSIKGYEYISYPFENWMRSL